MGEHEPYSYVNTGTVLDVYTYPKITRLRVQFDVQEGSFKGYYFATCKAFAPLSAEASKLEQGDRVIISGHMRNDRTTEEYPTPRDYVSVVKIEVLDRATEKQEEMVFADDAKLPF